MLLSENNSMYYSVQQFFPHMNIYAVGVKKFHFLMNYLYVLKKLVHSLLHEYSIIFKFEIYLLFLY